MESPARSLERDLNDLVPKTGDWPNLVGTIAKQHGVLVRRVGRVERDQEGFGDLFLWHGARREGEVASLLLKEWVSDRDPRYMDDKPVREFTVGSESHLEPAPVVNLPVRSIAMGEFIADFEQWCKTGKSILMPPPEPQV